MKRLTTTALITLTIGLSAHAGSLVDSLVSGNIAINSVAKPKSDTDYVLNKLRISAPPTQEGVEAGELALHPAPVLFSTKAYLEKMMAKADYQGQKIAYYEAVAAKVIDMSGRSEDEEVARMTLNRTVDTVNTIISVIGRNTDEAKRLIENFYAEGFQTAAKYIETPCKFDWGYSVGTGYVKLIKAADYGVEFSQKVQEISQANVSRTAEAVLLIKALNYLGQDVKSDYRTRPSNQNSQDLLVSVIETQQAYEMKSILASIDNKVEPEQSDVAWLRGEVSDIIKKASVVYSK